MNLEKWIDSSEENRRKYAYYLGLGYSEKAAAVLSAVTYGEHRLGRLLERLGRKDVLSGLYDWLQTREEDSPKVAVLNGYIEEICPRDPDPAPRRGGWAKKLKIFSEANWDEGERMMRSLVTRDFPSPEFVCERPEAGDAFDDEDAELLPGSGAGPCSAAQAEEERPRYSAIPMHCVKLTEDANTAGLADVDLAELKTEARDCRILNRSGIREALSTDEYEPIEEKDAQDVLTAPTSTFRMTTSSASMGIVFNQLRSGRRVRLDQVRVEEILNAFDYEAEKPAGAKFAVSTELLPKKGGKKLLFVNAQAAEETREHQNIVLLLDVSGSMRGNRETTQEAIAAVFSRLRPGDRISLVTYSSGDQTVFEGYEVRDERDREELMGVLLGIDINGFTWGSAGIETAYAIGGKYFKEDGNNQVILITDGDLNFGITDKGGLKELIEEKKKSGLFLSVLGTGLWNYKDDKLETLAKHGNGTYCVVNSLEDVEEFVVRRYAALTNAVAKDVKAQVEFNPRYVRTWKLLGYENRRLNHEDFRNDAVISEPFGSGGHGAALYELEMRENAVKRLEAGLKYQTPVLKESDELCTVSVRWKEPLGGKGEQIEFAAPAVERHTGNALLAYFVWCLAAKLRGSGKLDAWDEQFLDVMVTGGFPCVFSGPNREKLELLAEALRNPGKADEDQYNLWDI